MTAKRENGGMKNDLTRAARPLCSCNPEKGVENSILMAERDHFFHHLISRHMWVLMFR